MNKLLLTAALAGVMSATTTLALAEGDSGEKEKCYGIAKAGENHCASADGSHSCAGQATADHDANEWKYVEQGSCEDMGGDLKAGAHSCEGKNSCNH